MSEETELQAKIAALAGQINKHKRHPPSQETARYSGAVHNESYHPRTTSRWSPYLQGGRPNFKPIKNRTLVLANAGCDPPKGDDQDTITAPFVTSRAGSKAELMTKETFEREQRQRQQYQQQRALKSGASASQQSRQETSSAGSSNHAARVLEFDGIRFELQADGAKLIRVAGERYADLHRRAVLNLADPGLSTKETPKKVTIADVNFLRTKSGNLVRVTTTQGNTRYLAHYCDVSQGHCLRATLSSASVRAPQKQCDKFTRHGTVHSRFRTTSHINRTSSEFPCRLCGGFSYTLT